MAARQGIRIKLRRKDNKARFRLKYTYYQIARKVNGRTVVRYGYRKQIVPVRRKKYSYKK